jgi:hypothetical protein
MTSAALETTPAVVLIPWEAVQHLTQEVLGASSGELRDDATALCLGWEGGVPRDRDADSGANR